MIKVHLKEHPQLKTQHFKDIIKEYTIKLILEQDPAMDAAAAAPPPPAPPDPSKIGAETKGDTDPIQFVNSRIVSLIELSKEELFKEITRTNLEARKPLQIQSIPIDQTKDIDDFIKSFKDNYSKDYFTLKTFIEATTPGNPKYEQLKSDIDNFIKLCEKHINTDQSSINPSNVQEAPM